MNDAGLPLNQRPYLVRTPLQYRQQMQRLISKYPSLALWVKRYLYHYPQVTSAIALSLRERSENENNQLTYGETDFETFIQLLQSLKPKKNDHFLELGCGTGALCFLAVILGSMQARGVDLLAGFIQRATDMAQHLSLSHRLEFIQQDLFQVDVSNSTLIYVTATCFPLAVRQQLAQLLLQAPAHTQVVSVSLPLEAAWLREIACVPGAFSWGSDKIYIYKRIS